MTVNINAANIGGIRLAEQGSDPTTPASGYGQLYAKSDGLYYIDDGGNVYNPMIGGWIGANETWVYASADDPTYTFTIAGIDLTTKYYPGMRIKLTQVTGGIKYFIITKVAFSTNTTITVYGGTDYDLNDETISSPNYSVVKAPAGFPLSPIKWTVTATSSSDVSQATPVNGTWYNLGSLSIVIPIGVWNVQHKELLQVTSTNSVTDLLAQSTLSSANNSESDSDFTARIRTATATAETGLRIEHTIFLEKYLLLASKTTYFLNARTVLDDMTSIVFLGTGVPTIIKAVCAYL